MNHRSLLLFLLLISSIGFAQCSESLTSISVKEFTLYDDTLQAGESLEGELLIENSFNHSLFNSVLLLNLEREPVHEFGSEYVGELIVESDFSLAPGATKRSSFSWKLPQALPAGTYSVKAYTHSNGFNTGGISFINSLYAGSVQFTVLNDNPVSFSINSSSLQLSNKSYDYTGIPGFLVEGENVSVAFNLTNHNSPGNLTMIYRLHIWDEYKHAELQRLLSLGVIPTDSALADHIRQTSLVGGFLSLNMSADETRNVELVLGSLKPDAYLLVVEISKGSYSSLFKLPLSVNGPKRLIRFAGISPYPFADGEEAQILACLSSTTEVGGTTPPLLDSTLKLKLYSGEFSNGVLLWKNEHNFTLSNPLTAFHFNLSQNIQTNDFSLVLSLLDSNNSLMDSAELDFTPESLEGRNLLKIESRELAGIVYYTVRLTNAEGGLIPGSIAVSLMDVNGTVLETRSAEIRGFFEGTFSAPPGGYSIGVYEITYGLKQNLSNATPYTADQLPYRPPKTPQEPTQPLTQFQTTSPLLLLSVLLILIILGLTYTLIHQFRKKG